MTERAPISPDPSATRRRLTPDERRLRDAVRLLRRLRKEHGNDFRRPTSPGTTGRLLEQIDAFLAAEPRP